MATQHTWGYEAHNGPHTWAKCCDNAAGANQSPINIDTKKAVHDPQLTERPLTLNVSSCSGATLMNTGHGFQVKLDCDAQLSHGPLENTYKFAQFHMHWGREDEWGSEHTINGQPGAAELHLVFWNAEKYAKIEDAVQHHDGLAVLGAIVKEGLTNTELDTLFHHFDAIRFPDQRVDALSPVDILNILPVNRHEYYTYSGSLTTPPCNECVTWIVFKEQIQMSQKQLAKCRQLCCTEPGEKENCCLEETYRTPCPLGKRVVRKSFV